MCIETNPNPPETIDDGGDTGGGGTTNEDVITNPNTNEPCVTSDGTTGITGSDGCITTLDEVERNNLIQALGSRLSTFERSWVEEQASLDKVTQLNNFIHELSWTERDDGKDFATEVVKVWMRNNRAEVDFSYQVIVDRSFKENQSLMDVYEAMGKAPTFDAYLKNFDSEMSVANLKFGADPNFASNRDPKYHNAMAITNPPLTSNLINIHFNTDASTSGNILDKPDVFKAVSLIHEVLHAEMYRKMLDAVRLAEINNNSLNWTSWTSEEFYNDFLNSLENKYFGIFHYFTKYNYGVPEGSNPNDYQHQLMAESYRNVVKQALTEYDPSLTETQKEALSWIGLNSADIVAWQLKTSEEQEAIKDLIEIIQNNW